MPPAQASTGVHGRLRGVRGRSMERLPGKTKRILHRTFANGTTQRRAPVHNTPTPHDAHTTTTRRSATNFSAGVEVSAAGSELLTGTEAVPRVPRNHAYDVLGGTSPHPLARTKSMRNIAPSVEFREEVVKQRIDLPCSLSTRAGKVASVPAQLPSPACLSCD